MTVLKILGSEVPANTLGPQTFAGNTANVASQRIIVTNRFTNGQILTYFVAAGNTPITGLAVGGSYFATNATATGLTLSTTAGGANVAISTSCTSATETGHTLFAANNLGGIQTTRVYNTGVANTLNVSNSSSGSLLGSITVTNTEVLYLQKGMTDTLWCNGGIAGISIAPIVVRG